MYDPEMRKDCPMRGNLGNCSPVGGFCMDAVSDEICEAVHNAYEHGFYNALKTLKEQEPKKVEWRIGRAHCPSCGELFPRKKETQYIRFCSFCGQAVKWE